MLQNLFTKIILSVFAVFSLLFSSPEKEMIQEKYSSSTIPSFPSLSETTVFPEPLKEIPQQKIVVQPPEQNSGQANSPQNEKKLETKTVSIAPSSQAPSSLTQTKQETPKTKKLVPRPINLRTLVGIMCEFEDKDGESIPIRGSGVIVHPDGFVLTNRHVVDQEYTFSYYKKKEFENLKLKNKECKVYFLDSGVERTIPPEPQGSYQYFDIQGSPRNFDFLAEIAFVPKADEKLSELEAGKLDFALLKFKSWNEDKYWQVNFPKLHYAPVFSGIPSLNQSVVIPGFAYQAEGVASFENFRLLPVTGTLIKLFGGDRKFLNQILELDIQYSPDAYGGRSGSPIFYQGYLVGLLKTKWIPSSSAERFHASQVAIAPIITLLKENGLDSTIEELE